MCTTANYLICNMEKPVIAIYVLLYGGLNFLQNLSIKIECILFANSSRVPQEHNWAHKI